MAIVKQIERGATTVQPEPALLFPLGPPIVEPVATLFAAYQRDFDQRTGGGAEHPWERHEAEVLAALFDREGDGPSPMEAVLSEMRGAPVRIEGYERGVGHHRRVWVVCLRIALRQVRIGGAPLALRDTAFREQLGAVLGVAAGREWIGALEWIGAP